MRGASRINFIYSALCVLSLITSNHSLAEPEAALEVEISRAFFNPSLGQTIQIDFQSPFDGTLTFLILDRDGYVTRRLADHKAILSGPNRLEWDGRNQEGEIVPDEAYSIKMDIVSKKKSVTYFPAANQLKEVKAELVYYDRQNKVISYRLPKPSRVHAHAGSAVLDAKTQQPIGPVLKTLVNREPRTAGSIIEHWSGLDESGTIYVPELPNFSFSFSVSELPENSIICVGNRSVTFLETVKDRVGPSLIQTGGGDHPHHRDLSTLDDVSPSIRFQPLNGTWSEKEKAWIVTDSVMKVTWQLEGPSAESFSRLPGSMGIFLNDELVWKTDEPKPDFRASFPLKKISNGIHYVAINWGTRFGPLVASAFRVKVEPK